MLNPSTADASVDDPTVKACIAIASANGYGSIYVVNQYAYRATSPSDLWSALDPTGKLNLRYVRRMMQSADTFVCAWGAQVKAAQRTQQIRNIAAELSVPLYAFKRTEHGHPQHPLYIKRDTPLIRYG